MIEIRNVTKTYGPKAVVDDVSLTIPRGGVTSIIGANGAGKSTLLSIVGRILEPDSGTALVDGLDVRATPSSVLAKRLSVLRQDNHMTARLTVRDLVMFGRFPHSGGRPTAECYRQVEDALGFFELHEFEGRYLDQLSGGQRQRAYVAMVLAQDTDYVLLDEPLNNLDMRHATHMMRRLVRLAEERDKTVVIVIHDINYASVHSDAIVAMRDGSVIGQGTPEEMITPDVLGRVFDLDFPVQEVAGDRIGLYYR